MLRRTESYAGKAQRNIAAPYQQKTQILSLNEQKLTEGSSKNSTSDFVDHSNFGFKKLDEISDINFRDYCGPTPESNWVIPGVLLVGAYPASQDDEETYELITSILKERITKFVCLQQEYRDEGVTVDMWRSGNALRPYFHDVRMVVYNKAMFPDLHGFNIVDREALSFVHFPIRDCGITDDERVLELSRTLVKAISEGEVIYLHCWGGHGRTGTLVCIMLHLMYSLDPVEAMSRCQLVHDLRKCPVVVGSPQTQTQRDQVTRVIRRLMTQTHFHRRTLSDLFNHTGAARLSMMTEHSPRSDTSICRDFPNSPATSPFSPFAPSGVATPSATDSSDNVIFRVASLDEDSETEEVVAMGDSCLDDEVFKTVDQVVMIREPSPTSSVSSTTHRAVVTVTATVRSLAEGNADSYIDSCTCVAAPTISRNAVANASFRSPVRAPSAASVLCSSPISHKGAKVLSVFCPLSLSLPQNDHCLLDKSARTKGVIEMSKQDENSTATNDPDKMNVDKLDDDKEGCISEVIHSNLSLRLADTMTYDAQGQQRNTMSTGGAAAVSTSVPVSTSANLNGTVKDEEQELFPASMTRSPMSPHVLADAESAVEVRRCVETGAERLSHPVPVPPPACARPSAGAASSASGVLAGLRNFRMQWGGSGGSNGKISSPASVNDDVSLILSPTGQSGIEEP